MSASVTTAPPAPSSVRPDSPTPAAPGPTAAPRPSLVRGIPAREFVPAAAFLALAVVLVGFVLDLTVVSHVQYQARQRTAFDSLRAKLSHGTAPTGQTDSSGKYLVRPGTPMFVMDIPAMDLHHTVVFNGTSSAVLAKGPGLQRNSPLPGQPGGAIVFGRQAAFGAPFGELKSLKKGDTIKVTSGIGTATFTVSGMRYAGDKLAIKPGSSWLTLVSTTGTPFIPSRVLRVDATLTSTQLLSSPNPLAGSNTLPSNEKPLGTDTNNLWQLVLWLQGLLLVAIGAAWSWFRWGRAQTWIVFLPLAFFTGLQVANQCTNLLPNLM